MKSAGTLRDVLAQAVERQLRAMLDELRTTNGLFDLVEYHFGWGSPPEIQGAKPPRTHDAAASQGYPGRMFRPLFLLLVNRALGGNTSQALPVATAVEILHSAALVLDDIQDAGNLRRGRPSLWRVSGTAQAINVGVALQTVAHLAALSAAQTGIAPELVLEVHKELGLCTLRLLEGQHDDLSFVNRRRPSIDEYMQMCGNKTASLFETAAGLGSLLAERADVVDPMRRIGYHIGIYLQIFDDIAGIWGDPDVMGKVSTDLLYKKRTLPLLFLFQDSDVPAEVEALREKYFGEEPLCEDDAERLRSYAADLGGRAYAEEMAELHLSMARRALEDVGDSAANDLHEVIDDIVTSFNVAVADPAGMS